MKMPAVSLLLLLLLPLTALGDRTVSLAWDASPDASVVTYTLYVGTNGDGNYTQVIPLGLPLLSYSTNYPPPPPSTTNASFTVTAANSVYTNTTPLVLPSGSTTTGCTNGTCPQYGIVYAGLVPGLTYNFMVTASDSAGLESDPSNTLAFTVPTGIQAPILRKY